MITEAVAGMQQVIQEHGTFTEFVKSVIASKALVQSAVLLVAGTLGMIANWLFKWLTDQIGGSLWTYLFHDHPKRTILSFVVYVGWALVSLTSGIVSDESGWGAVINLGLTTGFSVDALVNKAKRAQWTEEERQAKS